MEKNEKDLKNFADKMNRKRRILVKELKAPKSKTERIPIEYLSDFEQLGDGDFKKGLKKALFICNTTDPSSVLMNDCNEIMDHLKIFYGTNHNKHFTNFPAFFSKFLETGKCDIKIMNVSDENGES